MSWLTDNIRWVQSITLEGDRLTADDLVVHRDMVAGARIDTYGVRPSFVLSFAMLLGAIGLSIAAFVETLQFFQPNYTVFGLSILPVIVLGLLVLRLRPAQHFTVLLRDGSALGMRSRDNNFLTRCLEAFERLWADPTTAQSSLYLHAVHRSADLGPPTGGIDVIATSRSDGEDLIAPLPLFEPVEDEADEPDEASAHESIIPPDLPPPPADDGPGDDEPFDVETVEDEEAQVDAVGNGGTSVVADNSDSMSSSRAEEEAEADTAVEEDDDLLQPGDGTNDLQLPDHPDPGMAASPAVERIDAQDFDDVRPKVQALVKLLRERAPAHDIGDAVDVLELMTRRGCSNPIEVRALSRAIDLLRDRMQAYPTAVELLERVALEGNLPPVNHAAPEPSKPADG